MSDGVVELQRATQSLGRAYNAYQGSSFCKYFAVETTVNLDPQQMQMRVALLKMVGQLIDTEFSRAMDEVVVHWIAYKEAIK